MPKYGDVDVARDQRDLYPRHRAHAEPTQHRRHVRVRRRSNTRFFRTGARCMASGFIANTAVDLGHGMLVPVATVDHATVVASWVPTSPDVAAHSPPRRIGTHQTRLRQANRLTQRRKATSQRAMRDSYRRGAEGWAKSRRCGRQALVPTARDGAK